MSSPFGPLVLIANPRAGRGVVARWLPEIERRLRAAGLDHRIVQTRGPGDATRAAREVMRGGGRYLVAAGGDGTVHGVVNGMLEGDRPVVPDAVLGVVACGSGCDFARSFGLPADAARASDRLAGGDARAIDLGKVTFTRPDGSADVRYFANVAQVGLGAATAARAAALPRPLGRWQYLVAFGMTLPGFSPRMVSIDADRERLEARALQVVVANARYYGGGMQISPRSRPDDGLLDALAFVGPKSDAVTVVPRVYRGTHLPDRNITELRAARVRVRSDLPWPIEADGEVLGATRDATFEAIRSPIRLKV